MGSKCRDFSLSPNLFESPFRELLLCTLLFPYLAHLILVLVFEPCLSAGQLLAEYMLSIFC